MDCGNHVLIESICYLRGRCRIYSCGGHQCFSLKEHCFHVHGGTLCGSSIWICDRVFADRTICIVALVVTCKIRVYYLVAYGVFFQDLSSSSTTMALVLIA